MQSFIMNSHEVFIHIHQGCFAGTGAIVRLPQCQWSKPDGCGKISQCITTTKHSKAKTVCIFLGIYCSLAVIQTNGGTETTVTTQSTLLPSIPANLCINHDYYQLWWCDPVLPNFKYIYHKVFIMKLDLICVFISMSIYVDLRCVLSPELWLVS